MKTPAALCANRSPSVCCRVLTPRWLRCHGNNQTNGRLKKGVFLGMTTLLQGYANRQWTCADDEGVALTNAATGEQNARCSRDARDAAAAVDYGRAAGGLALRELTFHQRASQLKQLGKRLVGEKDQFYPLPLATGAKARLGDRCRRRDRHPAQSVMPTRAPVSSSGTPSVSTVRPTPSVTPSARLRRRLDRTVGDAAVRCDDDTLTERACGTGGL